MTGLRSQLTDVSTNKLPRRMELTISKLIMGLVYVKINSHYSTVLSTAADAGLDMHQLYELVG
jgi:hypothetical protein